MKTREYYRKKLPHIQPLGGAFFVTWTLEGAIPKQEIVKLSEWYNTKVFKMTKPENYEKDLSPLRFEYFRKLEDLLHSIDEGPHYLKQHNIAQCIENQLLKLDGEMYNLLGYVIMSNHVHFVIDTNLENKEPIYLDRIMKRIKGSTAREANLILRRTGQFWRKESFDVIIKTSEHLTNVMNYIAENPVKAGLCKNWKEYPFVFLKDWS